MSEISVRWLLVPKEPTPEMIAAGEDEITSGRHLIETYKDMLAAAPSSINTAFSSQIDELAYLFWSVHPRYIDEWEKTAPKMPEKYPGGMRAWFFACEMRKLLTGNAV